ncbi:MAG TPA: PDDEXK nuclease domain-containing protein [Polyangiaceae bacterium]|jgi:predicted nuclease of restriction endonuclease-like (RecB) superfamily
MGVEPALDLSALVAAIRQVHDRCAAQASRAVNLSLTLRNWLIGAYLHEYELRGADRARYGERVFAEVAKQLSSANVSNCNRRQLYRYLRFYRLYPEIVGALSPQLAGLLPSGGEKVGTLSAQLPRDPQTLVNKLSYSHLEQIVDLDDDAERAFYEIEAANGGWSVRELKRQIGALYFQRSGLSRQPRQLAALVETNADLASPALRIRDPYIFEFLGVKAKEVMAESDLEDALLDKLQEFLLELGHGFCFEARQKRILIGDGHGFVDLVFYHRILKCHVLLELKVAAFSHEHLGQLNTYVSWYKRNMMTAGDNPPVGLLLCTRKDHTLVEYALADLPNQIFVSKYQLELPSKEQIQEFIDAQIGEVDP